MKICTACKTEKPLDEFHKDKRSLDGHLLYCKVCLKEKQKPYLEKSREKRLLAGRARNLKNREKRKAYNHEYNRKPEVKEANRLRMAEKNKNDLQHKLRGNYRCRIKNACKRQNATKSIGTEKLLGCSIEELKRHLESLFKPGMTWENHGEWHIDHKIPCSSFDLTDPVQQRECFHWSNLQPLWAAVNLSKHNKLDWPESQESQISA